MLLCNSSRVRRDVKNHLWTLVLLNCYRDEKYFSSLKHIDFMIVDISYDLRNDKYWTISKIWDNQYTRIIISFMVSSYIYICIYFEIQLDSSIPTTVVMIEDSFMVNFYIEWSWLTDFQKEYEKYEI